MVSSTYDTEFPAVRVPGTDSRFRSPYRLPDINHSCVLGSTKEMSILGLGTIVRRGKLCKKRKLLDFRRVPETGGAFL